VWTWVDGNIWSYENWLPGEPSNHGNNEHYVKVVNDGTRYGWNDYHASDGAFVNYICKSNALRQGESPFKLG